MPSSACCTASGSSFLWWACSVSCSAGRTTKGQKVEETIMIKRQSWSRDNHAWTNRFKPPDVYVDQKAKDAHARIPEGETLRDDQDYMRKFHRRRLFHTHTHTWSETIEFKRKWTALYCVTSNVHILNFTVSYFSALSRIYCIVQSFNLKLNFPLFFSSCLFECITTVFGFL